MEEIHQSNISLSKTLQRYENYSHYYILFQWCSSRLAPVKQIKVPIKPRTNHFAKIPKLFTLLYFISMVFIKANAD